MTECKINRGALRRSASRKIFASGATDVTVVLGYLIHEFLRINSEFSALKTTLRTTKLPSSRVLCLSQAQTEDSYNQGK